MLPTIASWCVELTPVAHLVVMCTVKSNLMNCGAGLFCLISWTLHFAPTCLVLCFVKCEFVPCQRPLDTQQLATHFDKISIAESTPFSWTTWMSFAYFCISAVLSSNPVVAARPDDLASPSWYSSSENESDKVAGSRDGGRPATRQQQTRHVWRELLHCTRSATTNWVSLVSSWQSSRTSSPPAQAATVAGGRAHVVIGGVRQSGSFV